MTSDPSSDALTPAATAPERTAAELGSIVAEQVRAAIETAERSAAELRREALEHAASDGDHVDRSARLVLDRIDAIEAQVGQLLESLREEVARLTDMGHRIEEESALPADPPAAPEPPDSQGNGSVPAAPQRRGGLLTWRRRALPQCAVCGRTARDGEDDLEQWWQTRRLSLCPECQADGWQVPDGASVPYRAPRGREPD